MPKKTPRRLFLDDDPGRANAFRETHPDMVWVQTAAECVEKLTEGWDEVHLDHDLGGEHYVAVDREDCGMEVVRWLTKQARPHLRKTRFTVHSHNMVAACEMVLRLQGMGYRVGAQPFGLEPPEVEAGPSTGLKRLREQALALVRRLRGLGPPSQAEPVDADPPDYVP